MTTFRFSNFELDIEAQQLRHHGAAVHLERRPLDLLILLVQRHGHLVSRDEIIAALWPKNVIIDFDSGLNTLIRKIRKALGDSSDEPTFIETVPGRGYRFIAPIANSLPPSLELVEKPSAPAPVKLRRPAAILVTIVLLLAGGVFILQSGLFESKGIHIAVMPFENLTGHADLGYLATGLAEETSTSLAQIDLPNLRIVGSASARIVASSLIPTQDFGRRLGADFVVLSSLRLDNSRIRVTSRLIRVADNVQVWSASFDRELTNVLGLQRELSIAIAEQVRQRLSPEVAAAIDRRQTQNPESYELYLKGRHAWTQFQPDSIPRALEYYREAVARDPGYGLAWAGIAHALATSVVTKEASSVTVLSASRDALLHALEYSPDIAETYLALGSFYFFLDLDLPRAEAAARKAVALDANSAMSHMFLGMVLSQNNKHVEARAMLRRARELDPFFPLMFANSAVIALQASEPQEALEFARQAIAINPEFWVGYLHLGSAWLDLGDYAAALQAYTTAEKLYGGNLTRAAAGRAIALAKLGREDEARNVLAELISLANQQFVPLYTIAVIYAGLSENDAAFSWLVRSLQDRITPCLSLANDPRLNTLRDDIRFESLLKRCNFAPELDRMTQLDHAG